MAEVQSTAELTANLSTYREQLQQVHELLASEPGNEEYAEMARGLTEVIELTEDLLASAPQPPSPLQAEAFPFPAPQQQEPPLGATPAGLPAHQGAAAGRIPVGAAVQARWREDGEWYAATLAAVTDRGYQVLFTEYGTRDEVAVDQVRLAEPPVASAAEEAEAGLGEGEGNSLLAAEQEAEAARLAIQRKLAEAAEQEVQLRDVPTKLRIRPEDPEDVKAAKKKKIHAFKSKQRMEVMELTQNKRQNAWQQFQTKGAKGKKAGYFTGRRKESIFKSPEDVKGKVGVTGSGAGMTEFQKLGKYVPRRGTEDAED